MVGRFFLLLMSWTLLVWWLLCERHRGRLPLIAMPSTKLFGVEFADHFAPCAFFQLQAGGLGGLCAFLGRLGAFCKALGLAHLGNIGGGHFSQHVQHQLGVGHVVAQVFFFQALVLFVVADVQAAPGAAHQVGQGGVFLALLHARPCPIHR